MNRILIINGANLNLLGTREPEIYGHMTLDDIQKDTLAKCKKYKMDVELDWFQSNIEGEIVNKIQESSHKYQSLIINPGGYSHTSVAILDALKSLKIPVIEVHLTQLYKREEFRQTMLTAKAAMGIMSGFGTDVYFCAIASQYLK